ncbi:MAG: class I SAM-dependent methyltransferase [Elusimicrobia bacterium]|nr:class I SAM-dependent methyltransferase [Elusimicrobiota bacterium]
MNTKHGDSLLSDSDKLRNLVLGMRAAYARGENAMAYARQVDKTFYNSAVATLIAYDLQAGTYTADARCNPETNKRWCDQLAKIIDPFVAEKSSILEVGCGEATTFAGVLRQLTNTPDCALGFDISWSRCSEGLAWLSENKVFARLFVADLFKIPLADASVDVVYTSYSLEPNGGREEEAIRELMRVSRRTVALFEPIFELAGAEAQARMKYHGYVRALKETAEHLGAKVTDYRLLNYAPNALNPSGVVLIEKDVKNEAGGRGGAPVWRCPLTNTPMHELGDVFVSDQTGLQCALAVDS